MDSWLTIAQIAETYAVSTKTVRRWITQYELEAWRLPGGRLLRIDSASLDRVIEPVTYRGYTKRTKNKRSPKK
mgnify:FL=1